jgi:xylulokinase
MILVVDLGTQSFRTTVLDRRGGVVFGWSRAIASHRDGVVAEQDAREWRAALADGLRAVREAGLTSEIEAATCAARLSGLVCLDGDGEPMRPAVLYADRRAAGQLAAIEATEEYRKSGWRAYAGDLLPQLAWLCAEEPGVYGRAERLLDATGYLNWLLTGRATLDRYTAFTCYAGAKERSLPETLFTKLGLATSKLGEVVEPGEWIGPVRAEWGLARARVISVSYDSAAAYLGSRLQESGDVLDISGTVTSVGVLSRERVVDPARRVFSIPYGDRWLVRGSTAMSGGVLEWARRALAFASFEVFDDAVRASPVGAGGARFLPYLAGARSPLWEPAACGVFHGLTAETTRADMARAVYEGLCFSVEHILQTMAMCGTEVGNIQMGGGLSRNGLLNQMKADVTGKRARPQVDAEVTTLGAASIAARALGWLGAADSYCEVGEVLEPDSGRHAHYVRAFEDYRQLAERLFSSTNCE